MFLHANHAALCGHLNILIRTVDTDVVVLAVSVAETLGPGMNSGELANISDTWQPTKYALGSAQKWRKHFLCFTSSPVVILPEPTDAMLILSSAPRDIGLDVMQVVERFVILL